MCTAVIDVSGSEAHLLAVRDEDPHREWDELGAWWPERPGVIGIRDRRAGGAWLAVNPKERRLAVLLNRADVLNLPTEEVLSRGSLVLESVTGRSPSAPPRMHGFNLLEVTPERSRVLSWDGRTLRETPVTEGVHMIAHDDLDDEGTARIARWLPEFRKHPTTDDGEWRATWTALLAATTTLPPEDDRAIIRDNRTHGYPTLSLLYCLASVSSAGTQVEGVTLARPGLWD